MRFRLPFALFLFVPLTAAAQTADVQDKLDAALARRKALEYVRALAAADGGFRATADAKAPSLRATTAGLRATKYLGGELSDADKAKHAKFVLAHFDPKTGGFADAPGGTPDVAVTAVGVMACVELGVPREKFAKAMDYFRANAKAFEEVRIAAAAVEAWGVADCPFKLDDWFARAAEYRKSTADGPARDTASWAAFVLRLGGTVPDPKAVATAIVDGQAKDGGWGKKGAAASDTDTTYRVVRALVLLKTPPKDPAAVRKFLASCRADGGGYGTTPGGAASVGGTYHVAIVSKWLDDLAK